MMRFKIRYICRLFAAANIIVLLRIIRLHYKTAWHDTSRETPNPQQTNFIKPSTGQEHIYPFISLVSPLVKSNHSVVYNEMDKRRRHWKATRPKGLKVQPTINCAELIKGNQTELKRSELTSLLWAKAMRPDTDYLGVHQHCHAFHKENGYFTKPLTREEKEFPLAFGILMHKDVAQTEYLLRSIYRPHNIYCIHIDGDSKPAVKQAIRSITKCFPNVFIASKLEHIIYGGFARLQADINCMLDLLKTPVQWKYYMNIASQAFPLRTNLEMVKILKVYNGANDIEGHRPNHGGYNRWRFNQTWRVVTDNPGGAKKFKKGENKLPPPHNLTIVTGSAYGIFSRGFVEFITRDNIAKDLLEWSKDTYSPDEHYWATLHHLYENPHLNTPGGYTGDPDGKPWLAVHVVWNSDWDKDQVCHGIYIRHICVYGIFDLVNLVKKRALFANKFYLDYQYHTVECLAEYIQNRTLHNTFFDTNFYEHLPFVQKR